jgi:hypothetical protein
MTCPASQKLPGMFTASALLVVENDYSRSLTGQIIAAIGSEIGFAGFAVTGFQCKRTAEPSMINSLNAALFVFFDGEDKWGCQLNGSIILKPGKVAG